MQGIQINDQRTDDFGDPTSLSRAAQGHDENMSLEDMEKLLGRCFSKPTFVGVPTRICLVQPLADSASRMV